MILNVIAILLSLAMSLTGAGAEGQPAEATRNLVLHNISVSYNGEALRLGPQAKLSAYTDGARALFDFGVDLDDDRLLPIQLGVGEEGVTAAVGSDTAVKVTAQALEGLAGQLDGQLAVAMDEGENAELLSFITDNFLPAYAGVLGAAADEETRQRIQVACQAAFDKNVDRGEGTPDEVETDAGTYEVTAYSYTLDAPVLARLADAIYTADPVLEDYYDAVFKLYAMLPEESGLNGAENFESLFEQLSVDMSMEINEQLSDDGEIDIMDAVLTVDMANMAGAVEEPLEETVEEEIDTAIGEETDETEVDEDEIDDDAEPEGDAPDEIEPLVIILHSSKLGEVSESQASCAYDVDAEHGFEIEIQDATEPMNQDMELTVTLTEDGRKTSRGKLALFVAGDEEGGSSYSVTLRSITQDVARFDANFYGLRAPEGTSENSVVLAYKTPEANIDVSFDLDVTADAVEDVTSDREDAYVIDDLSEAGIQALGEDQDFSALMAQAMAALSTDVARLTQDQGIQDLMTLLRGGSLPIDVDDIDDEDADIAYELGDDEFSYVIDGDDDGDVEYEIEDVEDDGVLGFEEPRFTWLPDGWAIAASDVDTAYDWVEMSMIDGEGEECAYAIFFPDTEEGTTNYIVQENGGIVEGREINVTDFGEGGLSVTLREDGLYGNMMFVSEAIDVETIGRIVAGIQFGEE